jgi:hypothetical protein
MRPVLHVRLHARLYKPSPACAGRPFSCSGEMEAEGLDSELEDIMVQLEAKYGRRLQPGYNPSLRFMSHLWEPLRHMYRCGRV